MKNAKICTSNLKRIDTKNNSIFRFSSNIFILQRNLCVISKVIQHVFFVVVTALFSVILAPLHVLAQQFEWFVYRQKAQKCYSMVRLLLFFYSFYGFQTPCGVEFLIEVYEYQNSPYKSVNFSIFLRGKVGFYWGEIK